MLLINFLVKIRFDFQKHISIHLMLLINFKLLILIFLPNSISIHLMLLINVEKSEKLALVLQHFNTSNVINQQHNYNQMLEQKFNFNTSNVINQHYFVIRYRVSYFISIHLMLLINTCLNLQPLKLQQFQYI